MIAIPQTIPRLRWLLATGLALTLSLSWAPQADAAPDYLGTWAGLYPGSASEDNAGCQICHGNSTQNINPYGRAVSQCSGATGSITARIQAAEGVDSDGQGDSNITEIGADTQPGWTTPDVPVFNRGNCAPAGTDTYAGAGEVDPAAANLPPVADANGPYSGTAGITLITFDGSASNDPDGTIVAYDWDFGDGVGTGTGVNPTYTNPALGNYTVTLTVTDDGGLTDTATSTATIVAAPEDPIADPNGPYTGFEGQPVTFDGSGSFDPDGGVITQYDWDFGDGNTGTGVNPTHTYLAAGPYTVTLTVVDDEGAISAPATTSATIAPAANLPPTSDPNGPYTGAVGLPLIFDGSGSSDPDGTIVAYDWDFGDGNTGAGVGPTHVYAAAGTYTVALTVTDDAGATDTALTSAEIVSDQDGDGVPDDLDNCILDPNGPLIPDAGGNVQRDTDGDNFGNVCDPDFNNDLVVNAADLAYMKSVFFTPDPDADLNGDGVVNAADLAILKAKFFGPPGPSGLPPVGAVTARGDLYATPVGDQLSITASRVSGVLYNDFGGVPPLTAQLVSGPSAGTLDAFGADGSFTYTPGGTMTDNQTDQFTYQAVDANGSVSAPATVVIQTLSKQIDFKIMMNYELGMHCTGFEFAYCCVLPPYNSILAQVVKPAQGDPACALEENGCNDFLDGYPRLLEGDPNVGLDGLNRETVVRDWDHTTSSFKKYQLRYYHDAQPRQEGNTSKPNTSTLISAVEGNSLQYFNTVFDSAQPDAVTNALVYGPYNGYQNVVQGSGVIGDVPTDNYANAWLNHFYIYVNPETGAPNLEGKGNTGFEEDKIRLGVNGQVAYPPDSGAALQPMGPTGNGAFENLLTFSANTGTVVYTQMKVLEDLPIMLTSPRIWEALGLPLTPFEDTINFFGDPGAVDEDAVRPYVAMKASLHDYPTGDAVMGSNGQPVIGFGTAPIDIPNCERCHSAPSISPETGLPNVNSPNWNRPDAFYPHGGPLAGTGLEDMTNLEYNFWVAYYDIIPGVDSDWYARLKGAAINMLTLHDYDIGTSFTANYAGVECTNNPDPTDPTVDPNSYACSSTNGLADLTDQTAIPQNTRLGHESVICQRCHADNVIANVKSATFDLAGQFPIPPITEAIHNQHRNAGDPAEGGEGGVIVFNDSLGRDGGCQGCHPAHRSDGVMDGYPITLDGDNAQADSDNRLAPGGCFVGRDVHSNPLKDVDGAETPSHLTAIGEFLNTAVANVDGEDRGIWCTNCHSQLSQEIWRAEDCDDLIRGDCLVNPRAAATLADLATAVGLTEQEAIDMLDPKVPGFDRTTDQTHRIWDPATPDANVATIEVSTIGPAACAPLAGVFNPTFGVDVCVSIDADGDPSVNILSFCTTQDCVDRINNNPADQSQWRYPANPFQGTGTVGAAVPFSAATDGRDHWLSAGEPHCADCHKAPYVEQSGNISNYPPFNYPAKASLMRYTRGHQDVSCQGCHESIHGLYPVSPTIDTTSYAQAAALNDDGSHGPLKCATCHNGVDENGIPNWVDNLRYNDPTTPGNDNLPVAVSYDRAVSWMHTYTEEADPNQDVCRNCHGPETPSVNDVEYLEHAMVNRVSRGAMDAAERAVNNGRVFGEAPGAQRGQLCSECHGGTNLLPFVSCNATWNDHLIQGRVSEVVWEEVSAPLGGCGW